MRRAIAIALELLVGAGVAAFRRPAPALVPAR